jgi:hypothetical protein
MERFENQGRSAHHKTFSHFAGRFYGVSAICDDSQNEVINATRLPKGGRRKVEDLKRGSLHGRASNHHH